LALAALALVVFGAYDSYPLDSLYVCPATPFGFVTEDSTQKDEKSTSQIHSMRSNLIFKLKSGKQAPQARCYCIIVFGSSGY